MSYSFTSKDAFKTITFAIKTALGKSIKVADVRNAAARSEGFPSTSEYLTALDDLSGTSASIAELPEAFETYFQETQSKMLKLSKPFCFISIDNEVFNVAAINSKRPEMYTTPLTHEDECELGGFVKAMNIRLGYSDTGDVKRAGFSRYTDEISLGFKPTASCLTEANDPFQNPELIDILLHQDYGTAGYLQNLVAHLWNRKWECDLPSLLSNSDYKHYQFTQSIIEHYKAYGESCDSFRGVASQVVTSKVINLAFREGRTLAEAHAEPYGRIKISHQEFLTWKSELIARIEGGEIQVEANRYNESEMDALMKGVERYEESVNYYEPEYTWL